VDHLHHGGDVDVFRPNRPKTPARQQHQGRPDHLAAPRDEVFEQRRDLLGPFGP